MGSTSIVHVPLIAKLLPLQLSVFILKFPGLVPAKAPAFKFGDTKLPVFVTVKVTVDPGDEPPAISIPLDGSGLIAYTGAKPVAVPPRTAALEVTDPSPIDRVAA